MNDLKKEHEVFAEHFGLPKSNENNPILQCSWLAWQKRAELAQTEINDLKQQLAEVHKSRASWFEYSQKIESREFVLVPKLPARKGGYYIQDKRSYLGNCMRFWYTHGYGTKHSKFHWFETLEDAKEAESGAGWFEIWYAPYIDSIIESTVDIQKAYRSEEKAMIEAVDKNSFISDIASISTNLSNGLVNGEKFDNISDKHTNGEKS